MIQETVPIVFEGGSIDGGLAEVPEAPECLKVNVGWGWKEVYERQNDEIPFVYVQIGYVREEQWN